MKISIKKILEDAKFTVEQHNMFRDKVLESIKNKNPKDVIDFLEENLKDLGDDVYLALCESLIKRINQEIVLEEGEEVGEVSSVADPEDSSKTYSKILSMLKPVKEKDSEFDYQILSSDFGDDAYVVTIRQYDEERLDTFIVNGSKGHTMADFAKWLKDKVQLYLGALKTGDIFTDGLQKGKDAYPDKAVKEEIEIEDDDILNEAINRAKRDKEQITPEIYAEPLKGQVGDSDTVSDNPDKKKTPLATKESDDSEDEKDEKDDNKKEIKKAEECNTPKKKIVKESVKRPDGVNEVDYKKGYDSGHEDKMNGKDPSITDEDESGFGKGYRRGYKDADDYKKSEESVQYDQDINSKINSSLSIDVEKYISEKAKDVMKGDPLHKVLESIKNDIKAYTTESRYSYIIEKFVDNMSKYGLDVYFVKEDKTISEEDLKYINDESIEEKVMHKNYPAKMDEPKGKEKEPKDPNFTGPNTTISDEMYKDFAEKSKHKVMTYAEAKATFEKMFDVKILPENENEFKSRVNNEIVLNGEGKTTDTISDNSYRIFKERSNAMAWDNAKDAYEKMFNVKLNSDGENRFKSKLNNDDLLAMSGKEETTVSDKIKGIGDMVDGKSKVQEEINDLKGVITTMSKNMSILTESMSLLINKNSKESIDKVKFNIINEETKNMDEVNKTRFEKLSNALVFESEEQFRDSIQSLKNMINVEKKQTISVFDDEDVFMSEVERKYRK
jgi:hypothetical protein